MASQTWTFTSGQIWHFTGSAIGGGAATGSVTASIECWGAGGHGSSTGNGGSGGAYAQKLCILASGSYTIIVGAATSTNGQSSSFISGGSVLVAAVGGRQDGTVTGQLSNSTGSTINVGGLGGANYTGYGEYNGGGGGGCGGADGIGYDGQSGYYSQNSAPASGGLYNNTGVTSYGGNGAYYYAGAGRNFIVFASTGSVPGCGGGGGYDYPAGTDSSAAGGAGVVSVWIDSSFS